MEIGHSFFVTPISKMTNCFNSPVLDKYRKTANGGQNNLVETELSPSVANEYREL